MTVPYIFKNAAGTIPLSQLDDNFTAVVDTTSLAATTGATLVGTIQSGTGAVLRTIGAKLKETVSVKDFGAVGDGVTDDTAAIQAAITYLVTIGGGALNFSSGTFLISLEINIPSNVGIKGEGILATIIKSNGINGRIAFRTSVGSDNRGPSCGGFSLLGNNIGTNLLLLEVAVERLFVDIDVRNSNTNGIVINGAQNCTFNNVNSQDNLKTNIIFDYGAGNNRFFGSEISKAGEWNIKFLQSGTSPIGGFSIPSGNRFYSSVIERLGWDGVGGVSADTGLGIIYHGAGIYNGFYGCDIAIGGELTSQKSMVVMAKDGSNTSYYLEFDNITWSGWPAYTSAVELRSGTSAILNGTHVFENHLNAFYLSDTATVFGSFFPSLGNVTNYFANQGGGSLTQSDLFTDVSRSKKQISMPVGQRCLSLKKDTDTHPAVDIYGNYIAFGDGASLANRTVQGNSRFGILGVAVSTLTSEPNFVMSLGNVDLLVLPFAPTQACPNGSLCLRTDTGKLYVRESGAWVVK